MLTEVYSDRCQPLHIYLSAIWQSFRLHELLAHFAHTQVHIHIHTQVRLAIIYAQFLSLL